MPIANEARKDPNVAREVLERLLPDQHIRKTCLSFLRESIQLAHQLSPASWGLTLQKDIVRLNVGHIEVITIGQTRIHVVFDCNAEPRDLRTLPSVQIEPKTPLYKSVKSSSGCGFSASQVSSVLPLIRESHRQLVKQAVDTPRHNMTARAHSPGVLRYLEELLDTHLPDPEYSATTHVNLSALTFQAQFSRFDKQVRHNSDGQPFNSFQDGLPADWEDYKKEVRQVALCLLGFQKWKPADVGKGRILERVIKAIEIYDPALDLRNNLVSWQNRYGHKAKSHRALLDAKSDVSARRDFEQWFLDFFHSRLGNEDAFERFRKMAGDRYDLIAYLFFLKDWNRFMPIAPTTFDKAFQLLGVELVTAHHCSWDNYARYNETLLEVQRTLREVAGVVEPRLIDAHSFCWMLVRMKMPASSPPVVIPVPKVMAGLQAVTLTTKPSATETDTETDFDTMDEKQFAQRDAERRRLGNLAQDIAIQSERKRLREAGHPSPEEAVRAVWDEPARGYDILSCELDGTPRYIEVKAARQSGQKLSFFLTQNEWKQSRSKTNYCFYLVLKAESRRPAVLVIKSGEVSHECLAPVNYLASLRATSD
jgi:hypothetical protein